MIQNLLQCMLGWWRFCWTYCRLFCLHILQSSPLHLPKTILRAVTDHWHKSTHTQQSTKNSLCIFCSKNHGLTWRLHYASCRGPTGKSPWTLCEWAYYTLKDRTAILQQTSPWTPFSLQACSLTAEANRGSALPVQSLARPQHAPKDAQLMDAK